MKSLRNQKTLLWSLCCSGALAATWALVPAQSSNAADTPAASSSVLAVVGGQNVTRADVESKIAQFVLERQPTLLDRMLDQAIEDKVLALEAAAQKTTVEALLAKELPARKKAVTDEEVGVFYEQNKARVPPNVTKEQAFEQIRQGLGMQREQEARQELVEGLKTKYKVTNRLSEERAAASVAKAKEVRPKIEANALTAKGPASAAVTVVEFSDFQCPFCSRVVPALNETSKKYADKVRFVFRQFPLESIHPQARKAAEASLCARDQGKFWELHDEMFADQGGLAVDKLKEKATKVGLDAAKFAECLDGGKAAAEVTADLALGNSIGVNATPTAYVNGRQVEGAIDLASLSKLIDEELAKAGSK
jgi:protein-disulfide isomerase